MHFITLAGHKTYLNCWLIQTPASSVESPTVSPTSGRENTDKQTKKDRGLETPHRGEGGHLERRQTLNGVLEGINLICV